MMQLAFAVAGITAFGYHIALPSAGISSTGRFQLGRPDRTLDPAGGGPQPARHRDLEPLHAQLDARGHPHRLHANRGGQGTKPGAGRPRHGLKNALIPLVTIVALSLPGLVAGAIVTESIFAWPGMGRLFINALGTVRLLAADGLPDDGLVLGGALQSAGRRRVRVARPAREVRLGDEDGNDARTRRPSRADRRRRDSARAPRRLETLPAPSSRARRRGGARLHHAGRSARALARSGRPELHRSSALVGLPARTGRSGPHPRHGRERARPALALDVRRADLADGRVLRGLDGTDDRHRARCDRRLLRRPRRLLDHARHRRFLVDSAACRCSSC